MFLSLKKIKLSMILLSVICTLTLACSKTSTPVNHPTVSPQQQIPPRSGGTVDGGGGGNKICGRPIDAFRINIVELPEFKKYIDPIFQYFVSEAYEGCNNCTFHNYAVGAFMSYSIFKKGWYIVPCPIGELSKEVIGSVYDSEQVAIQTFDEVWIDQERWNSLKEEDKALLLFHEMIMGIKILKYDSHENQCLVLAGKTESLCSGIRSTKRGDLKRLTPVDYKDVRIVTNEFFNNYSKYDLHLREDVNSKEKLSSNKLFRKHNFSNYYFVWEREYSDKPQISVKDLFRRLRSAKIAGNVPQYTKNEKVNENLYVASKRCDFDILFNEIEGKLKFSFKILSKDLKKVEKIIDREIFVNASDIITGYYIDEFKNNLLEEKQDFSLPSRYFGLSNMSKIGDRTIDIDFILDPGTGIDSWELSEMICTDEQDGRCVSAHNVANSEISLVCSLNERVSLKVDEN